MNWIDSWKIISNPEINTGSGVKVTQRKLSDYPGEKVERSPGEKVIRPPRKTRNIKQVNYKPKHRAEPPATVTGEQLEELKKLKKTGIEYHREKMEP